MKLLRFLFILLFIACSGEDEGPGAAAPEEANLEYPYFSGRCTEGSSSSSGKTDIVFRWTTGENTLFEELMVKNLRTQEVEKFVPSGESHSVTLDTASPYSWWILSYNDHAPQPTSSQVWKFYTSGPGLTNYAPFPADLKSPENRSELPAENLRMKLEWEGSDVDEELLVYDLYLGETAEFEEPFRKNLASTEIEMEVKVDIKYFWKILSRDEAGNTSESDVWSFTPLEPEEDMAGKSSEKQIRSFSIAHEGKKYEGQIDHENLKIHLELDNFDYMKLAPVIETSEKAIVVPESGKSQNFLDDLYYTVRAEDGSEVVYDIIVLSGQNDILEFEVHHNEERYIGVVDTENATVSIDLGGLDFSAFKPIIRTSNRSTIDPPSGAARNFNKDLVYTVTSEKGTTKTFKVIAPIELRNVFPFFGGAGYAFTPETRNDRFIMYPGAELNLSVVNVPKPEALVIELTNESGSYPLEVLESGYHHHVQMEVSYSETTFKTAIPNNVPSGTYNYRVKDGVKENFYDHKIEIINDDTTIRITGLNAEEYTLGDVMIVSGENLSRNFSILSRQSHYVFGEYSYETALSEDRKQLSLEFTQNVYGNFAYGNAVKPMAMFTYIQGYEHRVLSNTVYIKIKNPY